MSSEREREREKKKGEIVRLGRRYHFSGRKPRQPTENVKEVYQEALSLITASRGGSVAVSGPSSISSRR